MHALPGAESHLRNLAQSVHDCINVSLHICVYIYMCVMYIYENEQIDALIHAYVLAWAYHHQRHVRMHTSNRNYGVYVRVYIFMYIHIYTHTSVYTYAHIGLSNIPLIRARCPFLGATSGLLQSS